MAMFVAAIAFLLELALIAAGLIYLGNPLNKDNKFRKLASFMLIIGAGLTMLCTLYFFAKYMGQGVFDQAVFLDMWVGLARI